LQFQGHTDLDINSLRPGWYAFQAIMTTAASAAHDTSTLRIQYHSRFGRRLHDRHGRRFRLAVVSGDQHVRYQV